MKKFTGCFVLTYLIILCSATVDDIIWENWTKSRMEHLGYDVVNQAINKLKKCDGDLKQCLDSLPLDWTEQMAEINDINEKLLKIQIIVAIANAGGNELHNYISERIKRIGFEKLLPQVERVLKCVEDGEKVKKCLEEVDISCESHSEERIVQFDRVIKARLLLNVFFNVFNKKN